MKQEKSCGAVVLRHDTKNPKKMWVLVIRQFAGGSVSFPKGHMEEGESEKETAIREVFEETQVKIDISMNFRATTRYSPSPGVSKEVAYFLSVTNTERVVPQPGEVAEVFWVDANEAEKTLSHNNDKQVLRHALIYYALHKKTD